MEIHLADTRQWRDSSELTCLVVPVREGRDRFIGPLLDPQSRSVTDRLRAQNVFTGKDKEVYYLPCFADSHAGILLLGLGKEGPVDPENVRRNAGRAAEVLKSNRVTRLVIDCSDGSDWPVEALVEGLMLAQYRYDRYKAPSNDQFAGSVEHIVLVSDAQDAMRDTKGRCQHAALVCESVNWSRDLANAAPNDMTPAQLALEAHSLVERFGFGHDFLDAGRMAELGMNALLGVARGSRQPPKLIILTYHHSHDVPTLAIVGKGITFDTGGVSIKPSESMHEMKFDMCGAAAVLGAMRVVGQTRPPLNVVCVAPAAENCVDGNAQKPGDIVKAFNGKTIEVHNTDAEGRMILADALSYTVDHYRPDRIVDLATLTGACLVALGHYAAGVLATDDLLYANLEKAANQTGERIWRLPLWDDYSKLIEGTHADLCNIGPPKEAGTIVGGAFLKEFVGATPWAHVDIAGTAWGAKNIPYLDAKNASGYGVRLLAEWIRIEAGQ
jgi:leucyl aminopeptidase